MPNPHPIGSRWRSEWRWTWADDCPRHRTRVVAGLARMKDRLGRGKVWVARFQYGTKYDGSYETTA